MIFSPRDAFRPSKRSGQSSASSSLIINSIRVERPGRARGAATAPRHGNAAKGVADAQRDRHPRPAPAYAATDSHSPGYFTYFGVQNFLFFQI